MLTGLLIVIQFSAYLRIIADSELTRKNTFVRFLSCGLAFLVGLIGAAVAIRLWNTAISWGGINIIDGQLYLRGYFSDTAMLIRYGMWIVLTLISTFSLVHSPIAFVRIIVSYVTEDSSAIIPPPTANTYPENDLLTKLFAEI